MDTYLIFDSQGNLSNVVFGDQSFVPPNGCTAQLIPHGYIWNGTEIIKDSFIPINIETI
jgi:hypothetical protein